MPENLPFTIGADPEFAIRRSGHHVDASSIFRYAGGYLGTDVPTTGEVRPGIACNPDELVAKLYECFYKKKDELDKNLTFHAGHFFDGLPLGGHLQVGKFDMSTGATQYALYFALEFFLMECLSELIDDKESYIKRSTLTSYGAKTHNGKEIIGERVYRAIEGKGHGGFEYRTPGSWLISPPVAYANITLFCLALLMFKKHGINCYKLLPNPKEMTDDQRVSHISNIGDLVDIPDCCKNGFEFTNLLIQERESIDWNTNFREEWKV